MSLMCKVIVGIIAGISIFVSAASAEEIDVGQREYKNHCAFCHGLEGKGDGPSANMIRGKVADLSILQRNNKGVFPFKRVYDVIDGRDVVAAHGSRAMPVWGDVYSREATDWSLPVGVDKESFIRGRILSLTEYISRLQEK